MNLQRVNSFFCSLVEWQREYGRSGLPWQGTRDPYRVWLSEIMLQQTQVATVLSYYPRFLIRFPDVQTLAAASVDEVLALWSGLGYYSRARNLHRCAQEIVRAWDGRFPACAVDLQTLPGIGPSTAAAIAAFCFGERISILDGNVKRVLSRLLAFEGDLAQTAQERRLWTLAQELLPDQPTLDEMVAYTQGLMDLGAGLCARTQPQCERCPGAVCCEAYAQHRVAEFPVRTRKLKRRTVEWFLLVLRRPDGAIWLQQRPHLGIWAGLYCLPVYESLPQIRELLWPETEGSRVTSWQEHDALRHVLTHRDLVLRPVEVGVLAEPPWACGLGCWVQSVHQLADMGLPAPVRTWLEGQLAAE